MEVPPPAPVKPPVDKTGIKAGEDEDKSEHVESGDVDEVD